MRCVHVLLVVYVLAAAVAYMQTSRVVCIQVCTIGVKTVGTGCGTLGAWCYCCATSSVRDTRHLRHPGTRCSKSSNYSGNRQNCGAANGEVGHVSSRALLLLLLLRGVYIYFVCLGFVLSPPSLRPFVRSRTTATSAAAKTPTPNGKNDRGGRISSPPLSPKSLLLRRRFRRRGRGRRGFASAPPACRRRRPRPRQCSGKRGAGNGTGGMMRRC